jgi:hypothetical protein
MTRRLAAFLLIAALFLPACREDKKRPDLSPGDKELLRAKADEKIGLIITENLPALFAGVVVFSSDAFLYQSQMLDRANISVLNVFGNTAILLLNSPDIPPLLKEPSVKKIHYLCRQTGLARLDPAFEMNLMRRFGEGQGDDPFTLLIRFREPPDEKDETLIESAGFTIMDRTGLVWTVDGPTTSLYRLLESDRIIYYEKASYQSGVSITEAVPFSQGTAGSGTDNLSKPPTLETPKAIPFQKKPPPMELPATRTKEEK